VKVTGRVIKFDDHRGDGVVESDDGEFWYFHCVSILDGTRYVEVGTRVRAERATGHLGHDQLVALQPE